MLDLDLMDAKCGNCKETDQQCCHACLKQTKKHLKKTGEKHYQQKSNAAFEAYAELCIDEAVREREIKELVVAMAV